MYICFVTDKLSNGTQVISYLFICLILVTAYHSLTHIRIFKDNNKTKFKSTFKINVTTK